MNFHAITTGYVKRQAARIRRVAEALDQRKNAVATGHVIPSDGTLPIGVGRHLEAAVMFIDICGSSARPAEDIVEQDRILRSYTLFFSELIAIVEDYGGTIEKNTGDGLMAYFTGDADASDAHRSVACALTIFRTVELCINAMIVADGGSSLEFRICIDRGPITIAEVGAPRGFRGVVAIGTTANIASKMLAHAGSMELLIGEAVRKGLPPSWAQQFVRPTGRASGWHYRLSGVDYPFHKYDGRWSALVDDGEAQ